MSDARGLARRFAPGARGPQQTMRQRGVFAVLPGLTLAEPVFGFEIPTPTPLRLPPWANGGGVPVPVLVTRNPPQGAPWRAPGTRASGASCVLVAPLVHPRPEACTPQVGL